MVKGVGWSGNAKWAQGQGQAPAVPWLPRQSCAQGGPSPSCRQTTLQAHLCVPVGAATIHLPHPWKHPEKSVLFIYSFFLASRSLSCANCLETLETPDGV